MSRKITIFAGMFVAVLILIPFMLPSRNSVERPTPTPLVSEAPDDEEVRKIELDAENYEYSLKEIVINKGETVELTITSREGRHNFSVNELALASPVVEEGESVTIEFTADLQTGVYEYYCAIGDHRQRGMIGELVVQETEED